MNPDNLPLSSAPVADDELHALLDGQLVDAVRMELERRLQQQPEAADRLERWREQRMLLRGLHAQVLNESVPQAMRDALHRSASARHKANSWWRWGGMAASVLLAFGAGWMSHTQWNLAGPATPGTQSQLAKLDFARQAAVAHAVYAPEQRHPVEVSAAEQAHLVQWLSKRLGRALHAPQLGAQGFQLMGGRLLPGPEGARAQFMYQNAAGTRLTLYVGAVDGKAATTGAADTAFRFTDEGPVPGFYWVDQGFGYALSGPLSREALSVLAQAVYQQL